MCSCDDGDAPKVFTDQFRRARAGWACEECPRRIQHGQWYVECRGLWDQTWQTYQICMRCWARQRAWSEVEGCHPPFGTLADSIQECILEETDVGRRYIKALRAHRAKLAHQILALETARRERYRLAGTAREAKRRQLAHLGSGI